MSTRYHVPSAITSHLKALAIAVAFSGSLVAFSSTAAEVTFADAYNAYQNALKQDDKQKIEDAASEAFKLGKAQYAADSINYAALAMNYAKAIVDDTWRVEKHKARREQAEDLYQQALTIYKKHYGDDAPELADVYLGLATAAYSERRVKSFAYDAVDAAKHSDDPLYEANVQMEAFDLLVATGNYTRHARRLALDAYEIYKNNVPEDSVARIKAEYRVAQIYFSKRDYDEAEAAFLDVIKQFSVLKYSHPYALSAHTMLVRLYQEEGMPDKANEHCQAIGAMKPWSNKQDQLPLYRVEPKYPTSAAKALVSGYVQVEFTVDKNGFVVDPEIIKSKGGHALELASLKALKQWRYAPKFEYGQPIAAKSAVQLDFKIAR